jgi:hypothetical protein
MIWRRVSETSWHRCVCVCVCVCEVGREGRRVCICVCVFVCWWSGEEHRGSHDTGVWQHCDKIVTTLYQRFNNVVCVCVCVFWSFSLFNPFLSHRLSCSTFSFLLPAPTTPPPRPCPIPHPHPALPHRHTHTQSHVPPFRLASMRRVRRRSKTSKKVQKRPRSRAQIETSSIERASLYISNVFNKLINDLAPCKLLRGRAWP